MKPKGNKTPEKPDKTHEVAEIGDKVATSKPLPATTTEQEDITTAGQRRVNIIWEKTQRLIAIAVIFAALGVNVFISVTVMVTTIELSVTQLVGVANLNSLASLIVGFYFARTNHSTIGGVGKKLQDQTR